MEASAHDADAAATQAFDAALVRLEESVGGDLDFVAELIGDFLDGLPGQLDALRSAQSSGDADQMHRIAHTLKSNASTFGAEELALACRALEQAAAGGPGPETQELVARVEVQAALVVPSLASARDQRVP